MNHALSRVGLRVPDLDVSVEHVVATLGFAESSRQDGAVDLALPGQPPCLRLIEDDIVAIDHMTLVTSEDNLKEIINRCWKHGVSTKPADEPGKKSISIVAPHQLTVNIAIGDPPLPNRTPRPDGPTIGSLDHLSFTTRDLHGCLDFFQDVLGFRMSDSVSDKRHWLRCGPNHHTVAFFEAEHDGLQHYAFETADILEIKKLGDLLASRDQNFIWGPGRHGLGENVFSYHLDPAGTILEVCSDMVQIPDDSAWKPKVWREDTTESAIMWGQLPDPSFRQRWIPTHAGVTA